LPSGRVVHIFLLTINPYSAAIEIGCEWEGTHNILGFPPEHHRCSNSPSLENIAYPFALGVPFQITIDTFSGGSSLNVCETCRGQVSTGTGLHIEIFEADGVTLVLLTQIVPEPRHIVAVLVSLALFVGLARRRLSA
jgi:hypothetical protein